MYGIAMKLFQIQ